MSLATRVRKLEGRCPTRPYAHLTDEELEARIEKFLEGLLREAGIWGDPTLWQAWADEVLFPQFPPDVTEGLREHLKRLEDKTTVPASLAEPLIRVPTPSGWAALEERLPNKGGRLCAG